jgi:hypothetical protein
VLVIDPLKDPSCTKLVVHTDGWAAVNTTVNLDPAKLNKIVIKLK